MTFQAGPHSIRGPVPHYGAVPPGEPLAILGSMGYYEIAVRNGSAAIQLGLASGSAVSARPAG